MASRGRRGGAGERVLESRHVIGLFLLMLVFSGVFFALGYVMGRNQYDGQVRAEVLSPRAHTQTPPPKPDSAAKRGSNVSAETPVPSDPSTQPSSEWSFYNSSKSAPPNDDLKPSPAVAAPRTVAPAARVRNAKAASSGIGATGGYTLQVAAMRKGSDALALASHLQKKKFPAFVASPQGDKYYRVQVGPYADQKSAEAARKGLEGAGFKAIVKH